MGPKVIFLRVVALVLTAFIAFGAPWMAVRGPWVKYKVDVDRVPDDADTYELYSQYPMLMFERQQLSWEMCFTTVGPTLCGLELGWLACSYCICSMFWITYRKLRVSMGRLYSLLVADACWFVWWVPAFLLLYYGCCAKSTKTPCAAIGCVYVVIAFAARVTLSILAMTEFYRYDALTDPPHGGYVQNSTTLQAFTTRSYSFGFVCAWIVIGGNGLLIIAIICSVIYFCAVGYDELETNVDHVRTSIRRYKSQTSREADEVDTVAATRSSTFTTPSRNNRRPEGDDESEVDVRLKSEDIEAKV